MTSPMPTNETSSAGAVAKAKETPLLDRCEHPDASPAHNWPCALCIRERFALALDAFAREREAAVWEEAAKFVEADRKGTMSASVDGYIAGWALCFRARAAEARRTG